VGVRDECIAAIGDLALKRLALTPPAASSRRFIDPTHSTSPTGQPEAHSKVRQAHLEVIGNRPSPAPLLGHMPANQGQDRQRPPASAGLGRPTAVPIARRPPSLNVSAAGRPCHAAHVMGSEDCRPAPAGSMRRWPMR
jgi:hypothetical protein